MIEDSKPEPPTPPLVLLHPRREPFEHGLLPIPKLLFTDGTLTLLPLKHRLLKLNPNNNNPPVDPTSLSESLHLPLSHSSLILDTLSSVLPSNNNNNPSVHDLILFLYIQSSYKRLLPRSNHKDSADVWPSVSAFDGYLSVLSPLQLVRSSSRRFMPSQADEEVHQLLYLQKHITNVIALLADSVLEGEEAEEESLVLTLERFEHLEFLIQFGDKGCEGISLSQAAPFFANSDPDMPAVPVPAAQVHDWILEHITAALEHITSKAMPKENGPLNMPDMDVTMADASVHQARGQGSSSPRGSSMHNNPSYSRSQTLVEGFTRSSVVRHASDVRGHSVKVLNCQDSVIYVLAPLKYAIVYGCSDATIVLGAIGKAVRVEHCERVQVIAAAKRICIANCRECVFFLGVNQQPLILGDNHKLQVAPFNTYYSQLVEHMAQVGVDSTVNRWDEPLVLGMVDPHDSLSHPAGVSDAQAESATCLDPELFTNFMIPKWLGVESPHAIEYNPFPLPEIYLACQKKKYSALLETQQAIRNAQLDGNRKQELARALHVHFKEWLYASGNVRQLYCLQGD